MNLPVQPTYSAPAAYNHVSPAAAAGDQDRESTSPPMVGNLAILVITMLKQVGTPYQERRVEKPVLDIRA